MWDALAVRDPEAPVITDKKGEPLPDPELRAPRERAAAGEEGRLRG